MFADANVNTKKGKKKSKKEEEEGKISVFARQALVLQAAAPTAISVLLMAETEQADSTAAAQLIWRSTLMALITVPIWAVLLKTLGERLGT